MSRRDSCKAAVRLVNVLLWTVDVHVRDRAIRSLADGSNERILSFLRVKQRSLGYHKSALLALIFNYF